MKKLTKCHLGITHAHSLLQTLSKYFCLKSWFPMTAKMKMMISRTKVKYERAPRELAIIWRMSLRDFQDLANLKTL